MIEVNCFEEVIQIKTGTAFAGEVRNWATVYLVDGLLIDTGCHNAREDLAQFLQDHPVKLVVNTHYHEDHIGANHILQNRFGARLMASAESVPLINQVPEMYRIREILWGTPQPTVVDCLPPRIQTDRFCFDVIDTPGHCRGHV
ncbi:MAG: MBL fold metallo-hydrolase, partial [Chloroflexi bacterium]|nr:MBL fold metallo-hydrolase [Chloroflexota bacterium]